MRKKLIVLVLLIAGLFPLLVSAETYRENSNTNSNAIVIDDTAGVYSSDQIEDIKKHMRPLLEKGNVMLKTMMSAGERSGDLIAPEEYNKVFNGQTGLIVLINVYNGAAVGSSSLYNSMTLRGFGELNISNKQSQSIYYMNRMTLQDAKYFEFTKKTFDAISSAYGLNTKTTVNSSNIDNVVLEDDADLLTAEEEAKLIDTMSPLTEYGHIIFKTIDSNSTTTENYAHNYYYEHFGNESGTMFIIDMDNRYIYICSAGNNYHVITKAKANIITDNVYQYAKAEQYYECANEVFVEIKTLLDGGKIAEPMRYASNVVISLVLGFLLTFLYISSSMRIKKASRKSKMDDVDKFVAISNISVVAAGTHRVYSPPSSDSGSGGSSGGGGGGGGGGGFSGGGGGHSF